MAERKPKKGKFEYIANNTNAAQHRTLIIGDKQFGS